MRLPKITETKMWFTDDIKNICIKNNYYTCGDSEAYDKLLKFVETHKPTNTNIYRVAQNIVEHSEHEKNSIYAEVVTNVMCQISQSIVSTYKLENLY